VKIIYPSVTIYINGREGSDILHSIELYGRTCYKSEEHITAASAPIFVKNVIKRGHLSVIEHEKVTVRVICDRGVTHEIVRHRLGSYSQESTRYCNYGDKEIEFIRPCFWTEDNVADKFKYYRWVNAMQYAEDTYKNLIQSGATPQEARSILPNSLKTEIVITYNLREWRHFFELRCDKASHPQMREVANLLLEELSNYIPVVFDDLKEKYLCTHE
jgi:thymidylate synthase (FAD)